jgi:uncharacterized protein
MKNKLNFKLEKLKKILKKMGSCLIAYSGGVDSSLLLKLAKDTLGDRVLAVTALSQTYPKEELIQAKKMAKRLGVRHLVIKTKEYNNPDFKKNPLNRCYYCKRELFSKLKAIARKNKIDYILDGSNVDDVLDFRPGELAKKRFGVCSALREAGFKKEDIRSLSKRLHLSTWDKPSLACLASRFPYGSKISKEVLKKVDTAERFIRSLGFKEVRVRHYNHLARIEVGKKEISRLITDYKLRITDYLKRLGYNYVTVDLEGYRTGSMNPALPMKDKLRILRKSGVNEVFKRRKL